MQTILVIDDADHERSVVRTILEGQGYRVIEADNGEAGLELAFAQLPDLVLSDVYMGRRDGYSVLRALREHPATAALPCILMTGRADPVGTRLAMEQGADDYLAKPFSSLGLIATVRARLRKQTVLQEQAERKLTALRAEISLMLPHELNTLLTAILCYGETLADQGERLEPRQLTRMAQNLVKAGKRLQRLIQQFLVYAQLACLDTESGQLEILRKQRTTGVRECLESLARKVAAAAGRPDDLRVELADAAVAMGPELLQMAVEELLHNAFRFSKPGAPVWLGSQTDRGWLSLWVKDQGPGMSAEQIAGIGAFVQFHRKVYGQGGTGLGLTIAKRTVELHGGRLEIESAVQVGTCVTVSVPVPEPGDPPPPAAAEPLESSSVLNPTACGSTNGQSHELGV